MALALSMSQIADVEQTYPGSGRRHSPVTPLGRVMYRRHVSVHSLVARTGIKRQMISNYLCGDRPIRNAEHVELFAHHLQCEPTDLYTPDDALHWGVTLPAGATFYTDTWPLDPSRESGIR